MEQIDNTQMIVEIREHLSRNEIKEACKLLNKLYKKDKKNPLVRFWKCLIENIDLLSLYKKVPTKKLRNDLEKGVHNCVKIIESLSPDSRKVFVLQEWHTIKLLIGTIVVANLSKSLALHLVDMVLEVNPNHYEALFTKTTILEDIGRIEEAINICQEALTRRPDDIWFMSRLATCYALLGWKKMNTKEENVEYYFNEAKSIAERILKRDPHNCKAKEIIASVIGIKGDISAALKMIDEALQTGECEHDFGLLRLKADLLRDSGEYEEALEIYNELLDVNKLDTNVWNGLTEMWLAIGEYKKALESAKMAYFLNPYNTEVIINYVNALRKNKKYKEVQRILNNALKLYPNNLDFLLEKAISELVAGKYEEAKKNYLKIVSLNPSRANISVWWPVWFGLGYIEYVNGNYSKAMEYARRALKFNPTASDSLDLMAKIYIKQGEIQKALECYKKIYETSENPHARKIALKKIKELETSLEE